jgi:hypothetical protein
MHPQILFSWEFLYLVYTIRSLEECVIISVYMEPDQVQKLGPEILEFENQARRI